MKTLITILLLLHYSSATFIANCTGSDDQIQELVDFTNEDRSIFAEKFQIANMHELKWNQGLEREARKMKSCDDYHHGSTYRVDFGSVQESHEILKNFLKNTSKKELDYFNFETLHPLQTSYIHCYLTKYCRKNVYDHENQNYEKVFETKSIEFFGNKATFKESDLKFGSPGSECPNGVTKKGLCKT